MKPAAAELRDLQDRQAVQDVLVKYGFYADAGMTEAWLDLFHPDAWMDLPDYNSTETEATVRLHGRQELRGLIDAPGVGAIRGRSHHHMAGPGLTRIDGDDAVVDAYAVVFIHPAEGAGPTTTSLSMNRWTLRRGANQTWRILGCLRRRVGEGADLVHELLQSHLG